MIKIEDILDDAVRYLDGKMDAEELDFFETLLDQHPYLREELRFILLVRQGLTDLNKPVNTDAKPNSNSAAPPPN